GGGEVEVIAVLFGKFLGFGVAEDVEAFSVSMHQAVFDSVVHHFHEMPSAGGSAIKVALFRSARELLATWTGRRVAHTRRQRAENGIKVLHDFLGTADHHAVAAFETPNTAAGADVHIVDSLRLEHLRAAHVVFEVGVAAIDDDVALLHALGQRSYGFFRSISGGNHEPNRAWRFELGYKIIK